MRKLFVSALIIGFGLFLVSCGGSSPTSSTPATTPTTTPTTTPSNIDAQTLFNANCVVCHGQDRQGLPNLGPALTPTSLSDDSVDSIAATITNGISGTLMAGFQGRLTSAEITALATFVKTVAPPAPTSTPAPTTSTVDAKALYSSKCAMCHGQNREGTPALNAPALTPTSLADDSVQSITGIITNGEPNTAMMAFQSSLSSDEISALANYLKTVAP